MRGVWKSQKHIAPECQPSHFCCKNIWKMHDLELIRGSSGSTTIRRIRRIGCQQPLFGPPQHAPEVRMTWVENKLPQTRLIWADLGWSGLIWDDLGPDLEAVLATSPDQRRSIQIAIAYFIWFPSQVCDPSSYRILAELGLSGRLVAWFCIYVYSILAKLA